MKIRKNGKVVRLTESDLQRIVKRTLNEDETLGVTDLKKFKEYLRTQRDRDVNFSIKITLGELTSDLFFKGSGPKKDIDFKETIPNKDLVSILPFVLGLTDSR
jgi:hypothetical protein